MSFVCRLGFKVDTYVKDQLGLESKRAFVHAFVALHMYMLRP